MRVQQFAIKGKNGGGGKRLPPTRNELGLWLWLKEQLAVFFRTTPEFDETKETPRIRWPSEHSVPHKCAVLIGEKRKDGWVTTF